MLKTQEIESKIALNLLAWFDKSGRTLPWRTRGKRDPYKVWLAEIMLQQTTVAAVIPYYRKFLDLYPDVRTLAQAPLEEVLHHWAGLGYYARARNLHACANVVARDNGGKFPETEAGLLKLPGIGAYTAAAIAAIAFDEKTTVVDGNVERVASRLFAVTAPLPKSKTKLKTLTSTLTPEQRPGDFAEAMMDLGATVCTPKSPDCKACPVGDLCQGFEKGIQDTLPRRDKAKPRPVRRGFVYWLEDNGKVLVRRRPEKGLLGGMLELPTSVWVEGDPGHAKPAGGKWQKLDGTIGHTFTHFHLELEVFKGQGPAEGQWIAKDELLSAGFPTVMKKVIRKVLS